MLRLLTLMLSSVAHFRGEFSIEERVAYRAGNGTDRSRFGERYLRIHLAAITWLFRSTIGAWATVPSVVPLPRPSR